MAQRELNILIKAQDEASKVVGGINDKLTSLEPTFKKISAVGAVGFAGITYASTQAIKAFQEQETAEARLEQIAKQVTGATDEQIQGYKDLATQLQKIGVVGDEVVIAGQSQLASFTKNHKVVDMLSGDLADLAVAQYGVNVSQDQAIQTANLMGKALSGQLGALTRTGILVSDEFKTAFEEANDEQERAVILSQIIQDNYGGVNEAMRDTSAGGIQALKNSFGDLQENIGEGLIPILEKLVEKISPIIEKVGNWIKDNQELVTKIILITGAVFGVMAALYPFIKIIKMVTTVLKALQVVTLLFNATLWASPITWIIVGLVALIAVIVLLWKNWDEVSAWIKEKMEMVRLAFDTALQFIGNKVDWVVNYFRDKWNILVENFKEIIARIKEIGGSIGDFFRGVFDNVGNTIKETFKSAVNWVIDKLNWLVKQYNRLVIGGINKIPGVNMSPMNTIPRLAEGGIVNKPTIAMIGEAGPEAVVPLNKGFNTGSVINITVNGDISGQDLIQKISDGIMGNLRNNTQLAL